MKNKIESAEITKYRIAQYFSVFASNDFLELYLSLREDGDTHLTALETVNGERQMVRLCRK